VGSSSQNLTPIEPDCALIPQYAGYVNTSFSAFDSTTASATVVAADRDYNDDDDADVGNGSGVL